MTPDHDDGPRQVQRSQGMDRPQVPRGDEMQAGTPAPAGPEPNRDDSGRLVAGPGTSRAASLAAKKRWRDHRMAQTLAANLSMVDVPEDLQPFVDLAIAKRDQITGDLLQNVGGGELGPLTETYVDDGALLWALARYHAAKSGTDAKTAATIKHLLVAARGHWTMARDTAAADAKARPKATGYALPAIREYP